MRGGRSDIISAAPPPVARLAMLFLFPLVLSVFAALMIAVGDYPLWAKAVALLMTLAAAAMQFVAELRAPFLIPLFLQLIVCGWWYVGEQMD